MEYFSQYIYNILSSDTWSNNDFIMYNNDSYNIRNRYKIKITTITAN